MLHLDVDYTFLKTVLSQQVNHSALTVQLQSLRLS